MLSFSLIGMPFGPAKQRPHNLRLPAQQFALATLGPLKDTAVSATKKKKTPPGWEAEQWQSAADAWVQFFGKCSKVMLPLHCGSIFLAGLCGQNFAQDMTSMLENLKRYTCCKSWTDCQERGITPLRLALCG